MSSLVYLQDVVAGWANNLTLFLSHIRCPAGGDLILFDELVAHLYVSLRLPLGLNVDIDSTALSLLILLFVSLCLVNHFSQKIGPLNLLLGCFHFKCGVNN